MTDYAIPLMLAGIMLFSLRKTDVYAAFVKGAGRGAKTFLTIFPPILAVLALTAALRASGLLDAITGALSPVLNFLGIPEGIVPLAVVKPLSGSASLGVLEDIFDTFGADSVEGRAASVITGATETTFYTLCVYFSGTRVRNTRGIIPAAVIGDIVGLIAAVWVCGIIF